MHTLFQNEKPVQVVTMYTHVRPLRGNSFLGLINEFVSLDFSFVVCRRESYGLWGFEFSNCLMAEENGEVKCEAVLGVSFIVDTSLVTKFIGEFCSMFL